MRGSSVSLVRVPRTVPVCVCATHMFVVTHIIKFYRHLNSAYIHKHKHKHTHTQRRRKRGEKGAHCGCKFFCFLCRLQLTKELKHNKNKRLEWQREGRRGGGLGQRALDMPDMAGYHVHWRFTQQDEVKNQQSSSEGNSNNKALYNFVAQFRQERERQREEQHIKCVCVCEK